MSELTPMAACPHSPDNVKTLDEINEYANMPGREELLSMLASALQDPMRKIARAVKAIADKEDEAA